MTLTNIKCKCKCTWSYVGIQVTKYIYRSHIITRCKKLNRNKQLDKLCSVLILLLPVAKKYYCSFKDVTNRYELLLFVTTTQLFFQLNEERYGQIFQLILKCLINFFFFHISPSGSSPDRGIEKKRTSKTAAKTTIIWGEIIILKLWNYSETNDAFVCGHLWLEQSPNYNIYYLYLDNTSTLRL